MNLNLQSTSGMSGAKVFPACLSNPPGDESHSDELQAMPEELRLEKIGRMLAAFLHGDNYERCCLRLRKIREELLTERRRIAIEGHAAMLTAIVHAIPHGDREDILGLLATI